MEHHWDASTGSLTPEFLRDCRAWCERELRLDRRIRGGDASVDVSLEIGDEASHGVAATAAEKMEAKCVRTNFQSNTAPDVQVDGVDFDVFISVVVDDSPQAEGRPGR